MCPDIENPENLEMNEQQTYLNLPAEIKFSMDSEFLAVTFWDGTVKVLKMPAVIDPMQNERKEVDAQSKAEVVSTPEQLNLVASQTDLGVTINAEIEGIELQTLELSKYLIVSIAPKKVSKFEDPFKQSVSQ